MPKNVLQESAPRRKRRVVASSLCVPTLALLVFQHRWSRLHGPDDARGATACGWGTLQSSYFLYYPRVKGNAEFDCVPAFTRQRPTPCCSV